MSVSFANCVLRGRREVGGGRGRRLWEVARDIFRCRRPRRFLSKSLRTVDDAMHLVATSHVPAM
jgi:hypothetical protein